ncbi:MAG: hypothetical protein E7333_09185 [Clostridiales bacterium]|nr:hypothetical protein [Clostridiales bacterium]
MLCMSGTAGDVVINGGDFITDCTLISKSGGTLAIKGGTFSADPSTYLADGYKATEADGKWVVSK